MPKIERGETRTIYDSDHVTLEEIDLHLADGTTKKWIAAQRPWKGAVVIQAFTPSEKLVLIRQYRAPVDAYVWELPAGIIDEGETAEEAAVRELFEETGLRAHSIEAVSAPMPTTPGLSNEMIQYVYISTIDEDVSTKNNEMTEDIQVHLVDPYNFPGLDALMKNGDLVDAKCFMALNVILSEVSK